MPLIQQKLKIVRKVENLDVDASTTFCQTTLIQRLMRSEKVYRAGNASFSSLFSRVIGEPL
ncbi:hypothetical protein GCM10007978_49730 [Shewanella hanedai]|nr:hypothetical protein GCM10007978_49730 [Shewanella hanedai]